MTAYSGPHTYQVGEKAQLSRRISSDDIENMSRITGDTNPVHLDENFAAKTRFKGRIAHGVFGAGLISAVLGTELPGPGAIYLSQTLKFLSPVRPGDILTAEVEVTAWREDKRVITLATRCFTQDGREVLSGEAVLIAEAVD